MYVYRQLGISLDHYAAWQFRGHARRARAAAPGDLVFFHLKADGPGHVGIYVGDGKMIHAPHTGDVVRVSSIQGDRLPGRRAPLLASRSSGCVPTTSSEPPVSSTRTGPETISLLTPRVEPGSSVSARSGQRRPPVVMPARGPPSAISVSTAPAPLQRDALARVHRQRAGRTDAGVELQRREARGRQQHELGQVVVEARAAPAAHDGDARAPRSRGRARARARVGRLLVDRVALDAHARSLGGAHGRRGRGVEVADEYVDGQAERGGMVEARVGRDHERARRQRPDLRGIGGSPPLTTRARSLPFERRRVHASSLPGSRRARGHARRSAARRRRTARGAARERRRRPAAIALVPGGQAANVAAWARWLGAERGWSRGAPTTPAAGWSPRS